MGVPALLVAGVVGAGLAFLFDPSQGRRRRAITRDKALATFRRTGRRAGRLGRRVGADARGMRQKVTHLQPEDKGPVDDVTLTRKVESELFRDPDVPKGQININAQEGVVVLRGEVARPEQIEALAAAARKVQGVRDVQNLLHLKGTPAPTSPAAQQSAAAGVTGQ